MEQLEERGKANDLTIAVMETGPNMGVEYFSGDDGVQVVARINPLMAGVIEDATILPPAVPAVHEFQHSIDYRNGNIAHLKEHDPPFGVRAERSAIDAEATYGKAFGTGRRKYYKDSIASFVVKDLFSTKSLDSKKQEIIDKYQDHVKNASNNRAIDLADLDNLEKMEADGKTIPKYKQRLKKILLEALETEKEPCASKAFFQLKKDL